jgi:MFS transporter, DHA1 family, multidrug resistance protein
VRISPASVAFTVLLGFLVALPSFGIDMSLPALTAMGASFGVAPSRVGLMMGGFMIGFAVAPLLYGPASDRYGRKPIVMFGRTLFTIASVGGVINRSLPVLLWRVVPGAGAGASMTLVLAIIRDLFEGASRTNEAFLRGHRHHDCSNNCTDSALHQNFKRRTA